MDYSFPLANGNMLHIQTCPLLQARVIAPKHLFDRFENLKKTANRMTFAMEEPDVIVYMLMSTKHKEYRGTPYQVFLHAFYNCYSHATDEQLAQHGIAPTLVRGMARLCLQEVLKFLLNMGLVSDTGYVIVEADGEGPPGARHEGAETDRRPLINYYAKMGFQPLSATLNLSSPILDYVPMGATIGSIIFL